MNINEARAMVAHLEAVTNRMNILLETLAEKSITVTFELRSQQSVSDRVATTSICASATIDLTLLD